jgi:large subunit ribosomal protein L32
MAVPKKKKTRSKGGMTRAHWHLKAPGWATCPQCQEPTRLHHVCGACGFYKGKKVAGTASA